MKKAKVEQNPPRTVKMTLLQSPKEETSVNTTESLQRISSNSKKQVPNKTIKVKTKPIRKDKKIKARTSRLREVTDQQSEK